jgi:hypothetical protein
MDSERAGRPDRLAQVFGDRARRDGVRLRIRRPARRVAHWLFEAAISRRSNRSAEFCGSPSLRFTSSAALTKADPSRKLTSLRFGSASARIATIEITVSCKHGVVQSRKPEAADLSAGGVTFWGFDFGPRRGTSATLLLNLPRLTGQDKLSPSPRNPVAVT